MSGKQPRPVRTKSPEPAHAQSPVLTKCGKERTSIPRKDTPKPPLAKTSVPAMGMKKKVMKNEVSVRTDTSKPLGAKSPVPTKCEKEKTSTVLTVTPKPRRAKGPVKAMSAGKPKKPLKDIKKEGQQGSEENKHQMTKALKQPTRFTDAKSSLLQECKKITTCAGMARKDCRVDSDPDKILITTLHQLKIKSKQRSESAFVVNEVVKHIIDHMKRTDCFKNVNPLRTGSYYENLKISNPDEFDVMLTVPIERVGIHPFGKVAAFFSVELKRGKHSLGCFLQEDNTLSASSMLTEFRKEVTKCVKEVKDVELERKKRGCPAVTLLLTNGGTVPISLDIVLGLEVHSSWPTFTKEGFKIEKWLGRKVKKEQKLKPFYLVPKYEGNGMVELDGVFAKDAWRISFSHVEKNILTNHGSLKTCCEVDGTRCCRKDCLKLLKHLLALLKLENPNLSKFCSYYAKTTLLHACSVRTQDSDWEAARLGLCFQQLLADFEGYLKNVSLPNFFIPTHDLLGSGYDRKRLHLLAKRIEEERNNGFPIFAGPR
ncbi:LOW QUALITY PROTEIN: cyclic GMP-AMP synthase [Esox lucius]|uniref:LOW QUALITY PROTEIN: cyclic GMP-AMP synthase n=1 Tax=Esox lucius TaxID=8010 RepID=UPI00147722E8|nr:LOW QUALITY PROTEIN: cyclic GMP-AMP synthase [Esox lucius]